MSVQRIIFVQKPNTIKYNQANIKTPEEKQPIEKVVKNQMRMALCLNLLGAIGVATVLINAGKQTGVNPVESLKKAGENFTEIIGKSKDPIAKAIKNKRNHEAIEISKKVMAKVKLESLQKRIAAHEFNDKPTKALHQILDNVAKLQKVAQVVA